MSPLRFGLSAGLVFALAMMGLEIALAGIPNNLYEFCTTKAYGWPTPWKIDYCECEASKTAYPKSSILINLGVVAGCGFLGFGLFGGTAMLLRKRRRTAKIRQTHTSNQHPTGL